jgi:hypothetical protein
MVVKQMTLLELQQERLIYLKLVKAIDQELERRKQMEQAPDRLNRPISQ